MRTCEESTGRRPAGHAARLALVMAVLLPPGFALDANDGGVEQVLASVDPSSSRSVREGVRRLRELGIAALPDLLRELGRAETAAADPTPAARADVVLTALAHLTAADVRAFLVESADELALDERRGALIHLSETGGAAELRTLHAVAAPDVRRLAGLPQRAQARLVSRSPAVCTDLWSILGETPAALMPSFLRAVAEAGTPACLGPLGAQLDRVEDGDALLVLDAIAAIAERCAPPFEERARDGVARLLDGDGAPLRAAAAVAAGRLEDFEAAERLVGLLEDEDPAARRAALDALRRMTGLALRNDPQRWRTWLDGELDWWRERAPDLLRDLAGDDRTRIVAAVNAVVSRRSFRADLAAELQPLLTDADPVLRGLACTALGQLGTTLPASPPYLALVDRLDDREETVRAAAWAALRLATGLDLPPTHEAWSAALLARP